MDINSTDIAAWLGLLTGATSLAWDVVKWMRQGARLRITVRTGMQRVLVGDGSHVKGPTTYMAITVSNVGDQPTTITHVLGEQWKGPLWRRSVTGFFGVTPFNEDGAVPHVLEPGKQWVGLFEQTNLLQQCDGPERLWFGIAHSSSEKPLLKRVRFPK